MSADPPVGFLTRSEAARTYNRSQRALERDLDNALRAGDAPALLRWKLVTKDGEARTADQVTIEMVKQLQSDGQVPVWYVQESYLDEQFGRKGMLKPPRTGNGSAANSQPANVSAEKSTVEEAPTAAKADPSAIDVEFLRERVRTLEREKREEAERNETRETKLFEQLAVKDKQISAWDELTQGLMKGLATGQLRPDVGTIFLETPKPAERWQPADAETADAKVVQEDAKVANTTTKHSTSVDRTNRKQSRGRKKAAAPKSKGSEQAKEAVTKSSGKKRWYEMPTLAHFLSRK